VSIFTARRSCGQFQNQRTQGRFKQESSTNQARLKNQQESRIKKNQARTKEDSRIAKIKQESSKNQGRLKEDSGKACCLCFFMFVCLFVCFLSKPHRREVTSFKQALEGGSSNTALFSIGVVLNYFFSAMVAPWHGADGHPCFRTASKTWRLAVG
jgi:hypothetical protein